MNTYIGPLKLFIENGWATLGSLLTLEYILKGSVLYMLILWLSCIIWVIKDITNRTESFLLQIFCILLITVLTPILGLPVYFLIRPSTTLFEKFYEESSLLETEQIVPEEIQGSKQNLTQPCKHCGIEIHKQDLYCSHCGKPQFSLCKKCGLQHQNDWKYCPKCGVSTIEEPTSEDTKIEGEKIEQENLDSKNTLTSTEEKITKEEAV